MDLEADWQLVQSDDEPFSSLEDVIDFRGVKIPPSKLMDLCQSVEKCKTVELDCLRNVQRKQRKERWRKGNSTTGRWSLQDVSETTSRSTSSSAECREAKRLVSSRSQTGVHPYKSKVSRSLRSSVIDIG